MPGTEADATGVMEQIGRHLLGAGRVVLTTHLTPDGDGLGSALALTRWLRARGIDASVINCSSTPNNLRFLVRRGEFAVFHPSRHGKIVAEADAIVATDIGGAARLGNMERPIRASKARKIVIDHHIYENDLFDLALIRPGASSSAEVTYDLIRSTGSAIGPDIAEPLYAGLVSDTGGFCYTSTSSRALEIAAELAQAGADPHRIWRELSCQNSPVRMRVLGHALADMQLELEGRVAWTAADSAFLDHHGVPARDAFEVVNYLLRVKGVEVGLFLMEMTATRTKASLRSAGRIDVCQLAKRHGGGGHQFAAGCVVEGASLAGARAILIEALAALLAEAEEGA